MPSILNDPPDKNTHGEIISARKKFCNQALSGALKLFSPWSHTPALAAEIFEKSLHSCKETLSAPPLGKSTQTDHMPKLALLVADRAASLDMELADSPRSKPVSELWRSIVVEAFVKTSEGLDSKQRVSLTGVGPVWLLEGLLAAKPLDDASRWAAAELMAAQDPNKISHASLCLPAGASLFQVIPGNSKGRCCLGWTAAHWSILKTEALSSLGSTLSFPSLQARQVLGCAGETLWMDESHRELSAAFSKIGPAPIDVRSALFCLFTCPDASKLNEDWIAKVPKGSLSTNDALAALLIAPDEDLDIAARAAHELSEPDPKTLLACLIRLSGAPKGIRAELAQMCLDMLLAVEAKDPSLALAPILNEQGKPIKGPSLSSNIFEGALKAAINNKVSSALHGPEARCLTAMLEKLHELGFDMEAAGPAGSPSCMSKLKALKSSDAKYWFAWAESSQIRANLRVPDMDLEPSPARQMRL